MEGDAFPGGPVVKNPLGNAGDMSLIPLGGPKFPHVSGKLQERTEESGAFVMWRHPRGLSQIS